MNEKMKLQYNMYCRMCVCVHVYTHVSEYAHAHVFVNA